MRMPTNIAAAMSETPATAPTEAPAMTPVLVPPSSFSPSSSSAVSVGRGGLGVVGPGSAVDVVISDVSVDVPSVSTAIS